MTRIRRRLSIFCVVTFMGCFGGCATFYDVYAPPGASVRAPPSDASDDPDRFSVPASAYPRYVATRSFQPPSPWLNGSTRDDAVAGIEISDRWRVTHRIGAVLAIYSDTFQDRQCALILQHGKFSGAVAAGRGRCEADYLFHLLVTDAGRPIGWLKLHNPARVMFASDRHVDMAPERHAGGDWPVDVRFVPDR